MLCLHLCFQPFQSAFATVSAVILKTEMKQRQSHDTNTLFIKEAGTQAGKVTEDDESHRTTRKSYTHRTTWRKPYASPQRKQICSNIACRKHVQAKEQTNKKAFAISQLCDILSLKIFITLSAWIVQKIFQCQQQIKYFCQHQLQMQSVWNTKDGDIKYVFVACAQSC